MPPKIKPQKRVEKLFSDLVQLVKPARMDGGPVLVEKRPTPPVIAISKTQQLPRPDDKPIRGKKRNAKPVAISEPEQVAQPPIINDAPTPAEKSETPPVEFSDLEQLAKSLLLDREPMLVEKSEIRLITISELEELTKPHPLDVSPTHVENTTTTQPATISEPEQNIKPSILDDEPVLVEISSTQPVNVEESDPPSNDKTEVQHEVKALLSRIQELEAQLQRNEPSFPSEITNTLPEIKDVKAHPASPIIYEQERVGYAFQDENLSPLPMATFDTPKIESGIKAPLTASGETIGEVQVVPSEKHAWTAEESNLADAVAQQVSLQIQNLRLLAATERARAEAQEANRQFTHQNWESFMDGIRNSERIGYAYDQASVIPFEESAPESSDFQESVSVLNEHVGNLFLKADPLHPLTDKDKEMVSAVARQISQQVENLRLLAEAARARANAEEATRRLTRENWQSFTNQKTDTLGFAYDSIQVTPYGKTHAPHDISLEQPLTVRGEIIGQLTVSGLKNVPDGAIELANNIAEQVSAHIENLRLFELNEKRAHELETVAAVSTTASTVLDPDELLQSVVDLTKERFNLYHAHIYLVDDSLNTLVLASGAGEIGRQMKNAGQSIPINAQNSIVARASRERTAVIVNDVRNESDFLPNTFLPDTRAEMAVPMVSGDKVIGVFDVQSNIAGHFSQEDANIYTTLALQVAVALQNARLYVEQSETVAQLRELDRLKSSFLANMSHELRTPLNSILGFADVILEGLDGPLTENMNNDLGLIYKNGQHLLHLINDVLDMAKIESGKMNLNIEKFNLQEIIEEVTSITSTFASEKNLALFIEPDSDHEVEINADKIRLRQVMINLINNSIKFTEKGKISIRVAREGENALISVKDTGIGIPVELLESVFQEFTQVDTTTTRKVGGTGLGLPISRRLIEMHGGRLWAESNGKEGIEGGSTFYVSLPIEARIITEEEPKVK
jgi:signal transduction histidine kinase